MNKPDTQQHTRRSFLRKLWTAIGVLIGIEFVYLLFNFMKPRKQVSISTDRLFNAGSVDQFQKNSITPFRSHHFFLSRLENGNFLAHSTKCTHLGCILECDNDRNLLICPCHSSMFDMEGNVLRSPATRNLARLEVLVENNQVVINKNKVVTSKKKRS